MTRHRFAVDAVENAHAVGRSDPQPAVAVLRKTCNEIGRQAVSHRELLKQQSLRMRRPWCNAEDGKDD